METARSEGDTARSLPGSERRPAPGAVAPHPLEPGERIEATLILRRRNELPERLTASDPPVNPAEFAAKYGARDDDIALVTDTLSPLGIEIIETAPAERRMRVAARADVLSQVFGTSLERVIGSDPDGRRVVHRRRSGALSVPAALDGVVTAVLGLDDRPQAHMQFRVVPASEVQTSYMPPQLGAVYEFPAGTDGTGQTVAIIELGGGFAQADLDAYFQSLSLTTPSVTAIGVDGATNVPGKDPNGSDAEVLLDIEVAGGLAPGATFVVYFAPNTDAGFVDAVSRAAHATPTPTAISVSWGQSEDDWTGQALTALDQALADATALGAIVTVAAGDSGSADRGADGTPHVDFPASSPHALACGGTTLDADPKTGVVSRETVWNDGPTRDATGGGVSDEFGLPRWQTGVGVPTRNGKPGRGVPDVAANADPATGYWVRVDGRELTIGGTSAVAPLWAALIARLAQGTGRRLGPAHPLLYGGITAGHVAPGFRDVTSGDNGAYSAHPGWDACTGLGVPNGQALEQVVRNAAAASVAQ